MKRSGFTIIELIVVVGISAVLSAITVLYTNIGRNQVTLSTETAKLAQTILRAKDLAIATYNNSPGVCGYGVEVNAALGTYSIFAYKPSAGPVFPPCPRANSIGVVPPATRNNPISTSTNTWNIPLARGTVIQSMPDSMVWVLFYPPAPAVFISRSNGSIFVNQTSYIHLATVDGTFTTTVTINPAGQVSF